MARTIKDVISLLNRLIVLDHDAIEACRAAMDRFARSDDRTHLGSIQAFVQVLSVLASATGPLVLAACREQTGGTTPFFYAFAGVSAVLAVLAWIVRAPTQVSVETAV